MYEEKSILEFKSDLDLLQARLMLHQGRPCGDVFLSIQVCEQILLYLLNAELLNHQSQIFYCIEQINEHLRWLEEELVHFHADDQSFLAVYASGSGNCSKASLNEGLIDHSLAALHQLTHSM